MMSSLALSLDWDQTMVCDRNCNPGALSLSQHLGLRNLWFRDPAGIIDWQKYISVCRKIVSFHCRATTSVYLANKNNVIETKGPFIATQLDGEWSWVASAGRYRHFADATQLNSTSSWVELCRYRHPHRRNTTVADDRQCKLTQLQCTANLHEVGHLSWVELHRRRYRHLADATQLHSTSSWVASL